MRKKVQCKDGSWTFHNDKVGESYHTPLGAAMEAREKFAGAVDLEERANKGKITILDFCYGLGYNTAAALEIVLASNPSTEVVVYGLEDDKSIVEESLSVPFPFKHEAIFSSLIKQFDAVTNTFSVKENNISLQVMIGDARDRVKEVPGVIDVVFFDAFSPKKQPELWTVDVFKAIHSVCAMGAVLVTYSCARHVRENLASAGFLVSDGPVIGRRGPATIARVAKHS